MTRFTQILLVTLLATAAASGQLVVTTQFATNNNQAGNMFDVVSLDGIKIVGMDLNLMPGTWDLELRVPTNGGPLDPVRTNPGAWEVIASATGVVSNGLDVPTPFPAAFEIGIPPGETRGIYVTCSNGVGMAYTSVAGPVGNVIVDDGNVQILDGYGVSYPFATFFSPRRWNGSLYYHDTVDVPTDQPTLQAAINVAAPGQDVRLAAGTHFESDISFNGKALRVIGGSTSVLDAGSSGRGFIFNSGEGADSILEDITICNGRSPASGVNGQPGGGMLIDGASPTLRDVTFLTCSTRAGLGGPTGAPPLGGGPGGNGGDGGGVYIASGAPVFENCSFINCSTGAGGTGGIGLFGAPNGNGGNGGRGGAIGIGTAFPAFIGCRVDGCTTGNGGHGNFGGRGGSGGDLYVGPGASVFAISCELIDGVAGNGGGVGSSVNIGGHGGGVYVEGHLTMHSCVVADNRAGASADGGGIYLAATATSAIEHCTVADNTAGGPDTFFILPQGDGGGIVADAGHTFTNMILWDNELDDGTSSEVLGTPTILASDVEGGYPGAGNVAVNPFFLSPGGDNYRVNNLSSVVDIGDASLTTAARDADGETRIVGFGVDMGAFEVRPASLVGTNEDFDLDLSVNGDGAGSPSQVANAGDRVVATMYSPGGTFDFRPVILLGQVAPTGMPIGTLPSFPILHIPAGFILFNGLAPTPFGDGLLPPGGMSFAWIVPPPLAGTTGRLQGIAVAGFAANGILATSLAPELVFE